MRKTIELYPATARAVDVPVLKKTAASNRASILYDNRVGYFSMSGKRFSSCTSYLIFRQRLDTKLGGFTHHRISKYVIQKNLWLIALTVCRRNLLYGLGQFFVLQLIKYKFPLFLCRWERNSLPGRFLNMFTNFCVHELYFSIVSTFM